MSKLIALFLLIVSQIASAATQPANYSTTSLVLSGLFSPGNGVYYPSAAAACAPIFQRWAGEGWQSCTADNMYASGDNVVCAKDCDGNQLRQLVYADYGCPQGYTWNGSVCEGYKCPDNTWTLTGQTCTKADCPASGTAYSSGWYDIGTSETGTISSYACTSDGCEVTFSGTVPAGTAIIAGVTHYFAAGSYNYLGTAKGICTPSTIKSSTSSKPPNTCGPNQVLQQVNGTDICQDSTPVTTTTINGTTTTTGSSTTTTLNGGDGGDGGGSGGTATTTTTVATSTTITGPVTTSTLSDFCKANPDIELCKGGIAKEETQKSILEKLKEFFDIFSTDAEDNTKIENAGAKTETEEAHESIKSKFSQASTGQTDATASNKSSWETAMSSGWFDPIPASTCVPYSAQVDGRQWTWDLCPTAAKISEILGYSMWFGLVIGVFVMFTGGKTS